MATHTPELGASYSGWPGSVIWHTIPAAQGTPLGWPRVAVVEQRAPAAFPPPVFAPPVQAVGEVQERPSAYMMQYGVFIVKQAISVQPPRPPLTTVQVLQPCEHHRHSLCQMPTTMTASERAREVGYVRRSSACSRRVWLGP